jgi:hypothetical protein
MKALFLLSLLPLASIAADKHVHGEADLFIVLENGPKVLVEFESPAANIVGFEYTPKTQDEKNSVLEATSKLQKYSTLIDFPQGGCHLVSSSVTQPFNDASTTKKDDHDHHEEHAHHDDHKEHGHHNEHDEHEHHKEHGHHKEHNEHEHHEEHNDHAHHEEHDEHEHHDNHKDHDHSESHAEFHAEYQLSCKHPEKIQHATIRAFSQFAGIEKLSVQWITSDTQGAVTTTPQKTQVDF